MAAISIFFLTDFVNINVRFIIQQSEATLIIVYMLLLRHFLDLCMLEHHDN